MSIALIQESAKEVRRLAIAGSPLAVGDFRLKKLIAPLEQAGAKVPVFAQVAKAIGDLVNGTEADSPANLLTLSTLLNAILYTQGQTGALGDHRELESHSSSFYSTRTPARVLKPLVQALTTTGSGRYEIVKTVFERGGLNDLRLIDPCISALGDSYPELADLVADKILPGYGPGIIPRLKSKLDLKGKKQDARRLQVMHRLDPQSALPICKSAVEEGSPEVKAAAVACLGKHEDCLPLVLEQSNSKNKIVRAAALEALAEHDRPEIVKLFTDLIKGKVLDVLARPLRNIRNRQVLNSLIAEGKRSFELILNGEEEQIQRFWEILDCLEQRKDFEVAEFLLACFNQSEKLAKVKAAKNSTLAGADLMVRLASSLHKIGSTEALEALLAKRELLPPAAFSLVFASAVRIWPADKVYQEFAPLLEAKKGVGKEKSLEIERLIWASSGQNQMDAENLVDAEDAVAGALEKITWDPRWLDDAIKADQLLIVCSLAKPGHAGVIPYLLKSVAAKDQIQRSPIIQALTRCEYPQVTDVFLDLVAKKTKGAKYFDYQLQLLFESARYLPSSDLPKLDAFAEKLDEKFLDKYLDALAPLRSPRPPTI